MSDRSRRNAPAVLTFVALAALEILWRYTTPEVNTAVVRADFGITGTALLVSAALNFLGGLFRGKVDPNVKRALEGMRGTIADIGKAIVDGLAWAGGKIAAVLLSVKSFIQRTFGPLFTMLKNLVQRVSRILDRIIGPIINFLDKVRDHVWAIYRDFVKPVLDIIEFIRLPLRILSAFGVDWAKRLDATLANLEDWITDNFRMVIGKLNKAIDFLDQIVDVNGMLKRFTLVKSLFRDINIWVGLAWWKMHRPADQATLDDYRRALPTASQDARARQLHEYMRTGGGELAPVIEEALAEALLIAQRVRSGR